jgi:hypothetical protein
MRRVTQTAMVLWCGMPENYLVPDRYQICLLITKLTLVHDYGTVQQPTKTADGAKQSTVRQHLI